MNSIEKRKPIKNLGSPTMMVMHPIPIIDTPMRYLRLSLTITKEINLLIF